MENWVQCKEEDKKTHQYRTSTVKDKKDILLLSYINLKL